jgi:hypothetical protein
MTSKKATATAMSGEMSRVLVKVGAAEEVAAGSADQFAAAVFEARGAGGAVDGVVLAGVERALGSCGFAGGLGGGGLHVDRVAQFAIFSTTVGDKGASNGVRFAEQTIYEGEQRWIAALAQCGMAA